MTVTFAQPANGTVRPPLEGVAGRWSAAVMADLKHASATAPRSLQIEVGPSELGTPCTRRLGYRLLDWEPRPNTGTDPWPAMVGTAIHAQLADVYTARNTELGHERYLIEHTIALPYGIPGHCDLYDREYGDVVDWKTTGTTRLAEYRKHGPGEQYRIQAHLYGLGMLLAGEKPRNVVIVFLPRSGLLDGLHAWSEPFDHTVAVTAIERYQQVFDFHTHMDPEAHPERWAWLPTADAHCTWCPWYLPGSRDLASGCPGHNPR